MRFQACKAAAVLMVLILFAVCPALADSFTPITAPTSSYLSSTTLLPINAPVGSYVTSVSNAEITVSFSSPLQVVQWNPWGQPGNVEAVNTTSLWADSNYGCATWPNCTTTIDLTNSAIGDVTTFGLEAVPDPFAPHPFTVSFFNGDLLVGTISRVVDGSWNSGALLFAASTDGNFTRVVVSSDTDFAISAIRYIDPVSAVPEPASLLLFGSGLLGLAGLARRRFLK